MIVILKSVSYIFLMFSMTLGWPACKWVIVSVSRICIIKVFLLQFFLDLNISLNEEPLKGTLINSRCLCRSRKPRYVRVRNSMIIKAFEKRDL